MTTDARILIVDDNAALRGAMRALLRSEPTFVVAGEAANGLDAVRLAAELTPDVIVMDVQMPGAIDGIEATRRILGAADGAAPIVIALSGSPHHATDMLDAGASEFVSKEASVGLPAAIRRLLAARVA